MKFRVAMVTAIGGAALLVGASATAALAQPTPQLEQAAVSEECGQATLTFTNNTNNVYAWHYGAGDNAGEEELAHIDFVSVDPMSTVDVPVVFDEGEFGGSAFVSYGTFAGPEQDFFLANQAIAVDTDCAEGENGAGGDNGDNGDNGAGDDPDPATACADAVEQLRAAGVPAGIVSLVEGACALQ